MTRELGYIIGKNPNGPSKDLRSHCVCCVRPLITELNEKDKEGLGMEDVIVVFLCLHLTTYQFVQRQDRPGRQNVLGGCLFLWDCKSVLSSYGTFCKTVTA